MKKQEGITLVALVITIVVILILAGVSINVVVGRNGILDRAQQSVETHKQAEADEQEQFQIGSDIFASYQPNSLASKVKVGDYVNYNPRAGSPSESLLSVEIEQGSYNGDETTIDTNGNPTATGVFGSGGGSKQTFSVPATGANLDSIKWRVLSVENGCVNLVSEKEIGRTGLWTGDWDDTLYLENVTGYAYGVEIMNKICEMYGHGTGAKKARSITVEDVDKITGYNPKNDTSYNSKYGILKADWGNNWLYTYYYYQYNKSGMNLKTADKNSMEYKLIFNSNLYDSYNNPATKNNYAYYWLGSRCVDVADDGEVNFRIRCVDNGYVDYDYLFDCYPDSSDWNGNDYPVRPVVSLDSSVKAGNSTTDGDGITTWDIELN